MEIVVICDYLVYSLLYTKHVQNNTMSSYTLMYCCLINNKMQHLYTARFTENSHCCVLVFRQMFDHTTYTSLCAALTMHCCLIAVVTCPPIPTSDHDIYSENNCTSTRMVYNDTCTLTCGIGYNLTNSDGVRTCTENGTWSNSVKCERTEY